MSGERFHHVGLVVADLERSLGFYRDRVGLELLDQGVESDARYAEMLGVPRVRFAWAELDLGGGHVLELLRFDEPADGAASGADHAAPAAPRAGLPGVAHVGIRVDDVEAVHAALVRGRRHGVLTSDRAGRGQPVAWGACLLRARPRRSPDRAHPDAGGSGRPGLRSGRRPRTTTRLSDPAERTGSATVGRSGPT